MKKQDLKTTSPTPSPELESGQNSPSIRRPARHYLYGPVSVGLHGEEEFPGELNSSAEVDAPSPEVGATLQSEQNSIEEQNLIAAENIQRADSRAQQLVSGILETEKRNLPDWMSELLDPMDETAQLAFILKHRAEISATRRGRLAVPASPVSGNLAQNNTQFNHTHRRIYDTF